MTVEEWLGKDNQIGIDIWNKKYRNEEETFDEWVDRVSGHNDEVAELILSKRFLFGGRILANRGLANEKKITYSNCFSADTKILTKEGIKQIGDLVDCDIEVLSKGAWRQATVKSFGVQDVVDLTISKHGIQKHITVTPDHIWFARNKDEKKYRETPTNQLQPGMQLQGDLIKCYRQYKPSPFGVAHGFFWGDGDHSGNTRRVHFCGDKNCMIPYFTPDTIGESGNVKTICGMPKFFWSLPSLNETTGYLYGWLAGYFAADGSVDDRGSCTLSSSKREDLEFVQNVLCVLGIPSESIRVQTRYSDFIADYSNVYILNLNKRYLNESFFVRDDQKQKFLNSAQDTVIRTDTFQHWRVVSVSGTIERKEVFCAVVPETHCFSLDGNILTHNCYVVPAPEDNLESIFDCAKQLARTYSYGGGCGTDLSKLCPKGATVRNAAKESSGAVSFMDLYSMVTGLISQNGRRGALMISMSCDHPDIMEFIDIKNDLSKVNFANISVRMTDAFLKAVECDADFTLRFKREETGEVIEKTIRAKDLMHKLAENNWKTGEPGMLFWDRIEKYNLLSETPEFKYAGVNPCNLLCRA